MPAFTGASSETSEECQIDFKSTPRDQAKKDIQNQLNLRHSSALNRTAVNTNSKARLLNPNYTWYLFPNGKPTINS